MRSVPDQNNNTSSVSNVTVMFWPWPLVIIEAKMYAIGLGLGAQLLRSLTTILRPSYSALATTQLIYEYWSVYGAACCSCQNTTHMT